MRNPVAVGVTGTVLEAGGLEVAVEVLVAAAPVHEDKIRMDNTTPDTNMAPISLKNFLFFIFKYPDSFCCAKTVRIDVWNNVIIYLNGPSSKFQGAV